MEWFHMPSVLFGQATIFLASVMARGLYMMHHKKMSDDLCDYISIRAVASAAFGFVLLLVSLILAA